HIGQQKTAEDEGVAQEEDPHHGLAPRHILERALVGGPVGDDAPPPCRPRGGCARIYQRCVCHFLLSLPQVSNWPQMTTKSPTHGVRRVNKTSQRASRKCQ